MRELADKLDVKLRDFLTPFYVAMSGEKASTPLFQSMEILGSDMSRMRIRRAIEILGGISSKKLKAPAGIRSTDYAGNFVEFLKKRPKGKPFCFWYGAREPHRAF